MQQRAWDLVRKSIDSGLPGYGWHYDFSVIRGYDNDAYLLSGPGKSERAWKEFGVTAVGFLDIWSLRPGPRGDDAAAIADALAFAVSFGRSPGKEGTPTRTGVGRPCIPSRRQSLRKPRALRYSAASPRPSTQTDVTVGSCQAVSRPTGACTNWTTATWPSPDPPSASAAAADTTRRAAP